MKNANLKTYVKYLDYKFKVKYNRAQAKRLRRQLSDVENPEDVNEIFNDDYYGHNLVDKQPIRHDYM